MLNRARAHAALILSAAIGCLAVALAALAASLPLAAFLSH